jgi:PAS domain S-box-containing protein
VREVSCRVFERFERVAVLHGLRIEDLVAGLPLTLDQLRDATEWMDWDVHAELCDRLERATDHESSIKAGHEIWTLAYGSPLRRIAGLAIDLKHLYRIGLEWRLPKVHRNIGVRIVNLGGRRLQVELSIPSHLRGCAAWLRIMQGALEAAPTSRGLPRALVRADITPHHAVYDVTLPRERARPTAWLRTLVGGPALAELDRQVEELRRLEHERERMDQALRERERTLSNLIANLSGMVYRCRNDDNWTLEFASQGSYALSGFRPEELVGIRPTGLAALISPDEVQAMRAQRRSELNAQQPSSIEYTIQTRSGEERRVLDVAQGIYDDAGHLLGFEGFITDISARRRSEQAQRRLEEELNHSRRLEVVGRLASGLAHDFNNWLTVIFSNVALANVLLRDDHPARPRLGEIQGAAARAAALTQQMLVFARRQRIEPRSTNINDLLAGLDNPLRRVLEDRIVLETRPAHDLWAVKIDPGQLEQVLLNLAINARDAMPDGGHLTIETANVVVDGAGDWPSTLKPGQYVRLSIADTGTGMTQEARAHAFEPFFTTKGVGKGTGLGLASAHGMVHQAGGEITFDSVPGRGTSFQIYLPRATIEPPAEHPTHTSRG